MANAQEGSHDARRSDATLRTDAVATAAAAGARPASVGDFLSHLKASGAISAETFKVVVHELQPEHFQGTVAQFAEELVKRKRLTKFQAGVLCEGGRLSYGPYILMERLGEGGVATVCLGRHQESGEKFAIKLVPPDDERFDREVRAAARLPEHPNVISTLDRQHDRGAEFLVMEYVEGPNLGDYIVRNHPFTIHRVVEILLECARGLAHLHDNRIIHRDIKPENYVVGEARDIKLIDLGLARFDLAPSSFSKGEQLTVEGSTLGTPSYMSPEQIRDPRKADVRSDVYSLGCVLYNLLTGQRPHARINPMDTLEAQLLEPTPPLRPARSDVPEALEQLYVRMMAKNPDERPQQVADVVAELERMLADAPTTRAKGASVTPPGAKISSVGLGVLAGAGLAVVLLVLWLAGVL